VWKRPDWGVGPLRCRSAKNGSSKTKLLIPDRERFNWLANLRKSEAVEGKIEVGEGGLGVAIGGDELDFVEAKSAVVASDGAKGWSEAINQLVAGEVGEVLRKGVAVSVIATATLHAIGGPPG